MNVSVTNQDRKKAKATCTVLAVLLAVFAVLSVLFGVLIPKTYEMKTLGNGEVIKAQADGADGSDYFLLTDRSLRRFDTYTNESLSVFELSEIESLLDRQGDKEKLVNGSLDQWSVKYLGGRDKDEYLIYDGNGNMFKLQDGADKKLSLTGEYFLASEKTVVKGCDNVGDDLYVLALTSQNNYYVQKFFLTALKEGVKEEKLLWDQDLSGGSAEYVKISPMSASTGILAFSATADAVYVFRDGGSVIKLSPTLADYIDGENKVDYFALADEYYKEHYDRIYAEAYREYFQTLVLAIEQDKYSQTQIENASQEELEAWYKEFKTLTANTIKKAKTAAEKKAADSFADANPWCGEYDRATRGITVKKDYLDESCYSVVYSGESAICGIVYSKKNQAAYYANASDGFLYSVEKTALDKAETGSFLSDIAKKIESVDYGGEKRFSSFGNGITLNEFANTLYIKFENERTVSIVDLNDKNDYKILYTFEGDFDIYSFIGDKDNKVTHILRQVTNVALDASTTIRLYACTYEPARFEQKTLTKTGFIICLALTAVTLLLLVWFFTATKNDRVLYKLKIIQRDFKKNRFIYLALVFFIVILILFCYYEAIGAISMSFFDYTREKPAWIWNNFGNYIRIFNQPDFLLSVRNMLFFLVTDLILGIIPPLVFAFLLIIIRNKTTSNWVRSLMFIPGIIPSMATMLIWREGIYGADGVLNQLVLAFGGTPIEFLDNVDYARWSLIMMGFPFVGGYLIFYGGMMNIPSEYHEAGRLEGLGIIKQFVLIDIPLIAPQIKYTFIMTFIASVQNYARTYILGSSGTITPVESMYTIMTGTQADYGMASAYATLIFLFLFFAVATNFKMQKKETLGEDL